MGYTHYWRRPRNNSGTPEMFGRLALDTKKIINQAEYEGIRIRNGWGGEVPDFNEAFFGINGDASAVDGYGRDLAHEGFVWEAVPTFKAWQQNEPESFDFCKTAYKPYDAVITAVLIRAKVIYGDCVSVSSDGDWDLNESRSNPDFNTDGSWVKGRELYERVFGEVAACPFARSSV